jgi:hypothetical protein
MVAIAVTVVAAQEASAELIVKETREGGISVIRITPDEGAEKIYRIDLSHQHSPASEPNALLKTWESYRLGAFICFNTNPFSGIEICRATDPKAYNPEQLDVAGWVAPSLRSGVLS